jgi:hypothetical protein
LADYIYILLQLGRAYQRGSSAVAAYEEKAVRDERRKWQSRSRESEWGRTRLVLVFPNNSSNKQKESIFLKA